jgi:hypothetical protein
MIWLIYKCNDDSHGGKKSDNKWREANEARLETNETMLSTKR